MVNSCYNTFFFGKNSNALKNFEQYKVFKQIGLFISNSLSLLDGKTFDKKSSMTMRILSIFCKKERYPLP